MKVVLFYFSALVLSFIPMKRLARYVTVALPIVSIFFTFFSKDFSLVLFGKDGVSLILDDGSRYFLVLTAIVYTGVALYRFKEDWKYIDQFLFLSSFATLSLTYISNDLFNLYVMMEVLSIQAGLMAFKKINRDTLWATLKYLIVGVIGANIYLIGVGMIYSENGTFSVALIEKVGDVSFVLVITGLMIRIGVFGFGMWPTSFYPAVSEDLSALFSATFVKSGVYTFYRLWNNQNFSEKLSSISWLAAVLVIGASILSLSKHKLKDVIATSSMAHLGLMIFSGNLIPLYSFTHGLAKAPLFLGSQRKDMGLTDFVFYTSFILSMIGAPLTPAGNVEKSILESMNSVLKFLVMFSSALLGYSFFSRFRSRINGLKVSAHNLFFFIIFVISVFKTFKGFHLESIAAPAIGVIASLIFGKRIVLKRLEYLERLDVNVVSILLILSITVWAVII